MPSFFQFVKRMASGEPIYQQGDPVEPAATDSPKPQAPGRKSIPQVMITRSECRISKPRMNCIAEIRNASDQAIFLDEVHIFGVKRELQRELRPGEERELEIYDGPLVTGRFIDECYLLYRDQTGDYFRSTHDVDCEQLPDGSQQVKRIRFLPPVKDV